MFESYSEKNKSIELVVLNRSLSKKDLLKFDEHANDSVRSELLELIPQHRISKKRKLKTLKNLMGITIDLMPDYANKWQKFTKFLTTPIIEI